MADAGGKNFVFWFSRTQENASLDTFSKNFVLCHQCFLFSRKVEGPWPTRLLVARALYGNNYVGLHEVQG